jgi:hypothetical protein
VDELGHRFLRADVVADAGAADDETVIDQDGVGALAHGAAVPEFRGELGEGGEALAGWECAVGDATAQDLGDLEVRRGRLCFGHVNPPWHGAVVVTEYPPARYCIGTVTPC